jgi:2-haloacid dehalogenase
MRGGNNVGIKCAWYNPDGKENDTDLKIDYVITNLNEIKDIIGLN